MNKIDRKISVWASFLMALGIGLGAFGAHGLEQLVDTDALNTFEIGVRYQLMHCLALLAIGLSGRVPEKVAGLVLICFLLGILLFSGSLYLLAVDDALSIDLGFLGPITPLGGTAFIVGWLILGYKLWKNR